MAKITETLLRDAHQSLAATRMRTDDMLDGLELLDEIGYHSIEMWGGATFDVCLRYLNENPWERLRQIKKRLKKTPCQMLLRGQNLIGYRHYADDVVDRFVELAATNGIDIFRVFDALNDPRNMERAIAAVLKAGKHAQGTISFTRSPVHSVAGFVKFAAVLKDMGCQSICIKDMAGLLTPQDTLPLVAALKKEIALPVQVHSHNTAGYAQATYFAAVIAGADVVDCALSPFANGTSQPPTESMVAALAGTKWDTKIDLAVFEKATEHYMKVMEKYRGLIDPLSERIDVRVLKYQVPGGMLSNLVSQLKQAGKIDKFEDVLLEVPRVRKDVGWVPLVTPTSQIVGAQAAMNVIMGERYKSVSKEIRELAMGRYGKTPAPVSPELLAKVSNGEKQVTCRAADLIPPALPALRDKFKSIIKNDEDLLSLAIFEQQAERFLSGKAIAEEIPAADAPASDSGAKAAPAQPRSYVVVVGGKNYNVEVHPTDGMKINGVPAPKAAAEVKSSAVLQTSVAQIPATAPSGPVPAPAAVPASGERIVNVTSPMQGLIMSFSVKVGAFVKRGQSVGLLEAMKMENDILATENGTVAEILVSPGEAVQADQAVMRISVA